MWDAIGQCHGFRVIALALWTGMLAANPVADAQDLTALRFHEPNPAWPYWHFTAHLVLPQETQIHVDRLEVNGAVVRDVYLYGEDERVDPEKPLERRRLAIAEAVRSPRPEARYRRPMVVGRVDWRDGANYTVSLTARLGDRDAAPFTASATATAPATGGYWDPAWPHYQSVVLTETVGLARTHEPVEAVLLFYPDTLTDPAREIRVLRLDRGRLSEVPFQVMHTDHVDAVEPPMYDETGQRKAATFMPTKSATVVFPAHVDARASAVYLVFHGNADAPAPVFEPGVRVSGSAPGQTVENAYYRMALHPDSGMLDEVTLLSKPDHTFVHKKETNGAIQWNPDCYAPPRPWVHVSDWKPGQYDYHYEESVGPLVFRTRRWGDMPLMPELTVSMEYEFYAGVPYYRMRSSMRVRHGVDVQALRNAEVVFAREVFSHAAWYDADTGRIATRHITAAPDLTEWTMAADTPWLAFYSPDTGCGFAGIQLAYANGGLEGRVSTQNPYMYITTGPWVYWTRALAYPYGGRNPQQLIRIQPGSVYLEEWAYLPFEVEGSGRRAFQDVATWHEKLTHPVEVHVVAATDPRMDVPEEIYIEPSATGWEEGK